MDVFFTGWENRIMETKITGMEINKEDLPAYDGISKCNGVIEKLTGMKIEKAVKFLGDLYNTANSKFPFKSDKAQKEAFIKAALPPSANYEVLCFWIRARLGFFWRLEDVRSFLA